MVVAAVRTFERAATTAAAAAAAAAAAGGATSCSECCTDCSGDRETAATCYGQRLLSISRRYRTTV